MGAPPELSTQRLGTFTRLRDELPFYSRHCLKIRDKAGQLVPFIFNRAQSYLHARIEAQRKKTGRVRVVIVKGRQQGCSTYISARYFHRSTLHSGTNVFILAHISDSTRHIFKMVGAFYDNCPEPMKPSVKVSNQRNLEFEGLGSEYSVGTAGSADVGRSMTLQLFHGSEVAFWPNTDELMGGVMQGVADLPGTEIVFESTANGLGNMFHSLAIAGLRPDSDFITIFIPWFWQDEYKSPTPTGFCPTEEESKLMDTYGLSLEQIYWRRKKINDTFGGKLWAFMREYPCTLQEAFITSGESLHSGELIAKARQNTVPDNAAPLILGVDPARSGDDTALCWRRGRQVVKKREYNDMDEMKLVGIVAAELDKGQVQMTFIDVGLGYGTIDRLRELGYGRWIRGVHFGESALEAEIYLNKRTEMYDESRKWFEDGGANIPDEDGFATGLLSIPPLKQTVGRGVLALPSKDEIKKGMGAEQKQLLNQTDAFALTFAYPVAASAAHNRVTRVDAPVIRVKSPLGTIKRFAKSHKSDGGYSTTFKLS